MDSKEGIVGSSIVLLAMFNVFNLLNLIFQIFVAHNLSVEDYGIFTALFSFVYIFAIFSESIQLSVTKKVAESKSKIEISKIFQGGIRSSLVIATFSFALYFVLFFFSNKAFDIPWILITLNSLTAFLALTSPVVRGVLQGQKRFFELGKNMIVEGSAKMVFGLLFIFLGWRVYGALGAVVVSMAIPIFYGIKWQLKNTLKKVKISKVEISSYNAFTRETLFVVGSVLLIFMIDSLLARAILSPENAGYYAIASTLAKMAFIGTQPISKALISFAVTEKNREKSIKMFKKSMLILLYILFLGIIIVSIFSDLLVSLFGGVDKISASGILPIVLISVSLVSIANLILFYKIAINKTKRFWVLPFIVFLFFIIANIAPATLIGFSLSYLASTIIFLIASILVIK